MAPVLAWSGSLAPPLAGKTLSGATGLLTAGWTLVGLGLVAAAAVALNKRK